MEAYSIKVSWYAEHVSWKLAWQINQYEAAIQYFRIKVDSF
jgi:hypothetical protein